MWYILREQFFDRIRITGGQPSKSIKLVHTVSGAGFDVGSDVCKVRSCRHRYELTGDFFTALNKSQGTFTEIVCCGHVQILNPSKIELSVLVNTVDQSLLILAEVCVFFFFVFFLSEGEELIQLFEKGGNEFIGN